MVNTNIDVGKCYAWVLLKAKMKNMVNTDIDFRKCYAWSPAKSKNEKYA